MQPATKHYRHSESIFSAQPAANDAAQCLGMTTPVERHRAKAVIFAGAAAIALLALFDAAALATGESPTTPSSVRLVDQTNDLPAPPPPGPPPGVLLAPGLPWPPATPLQQDPSMVLPGGLPLPSLPQGVALSPELQQEISQMYLQGQQMLAAGPPPNVPDEVCRYNTVRVPCPPA